MKTYSTRKLRVMTPEIILCLILTSCSGHLIAPGGTGHSDPLSFGPEQRLGHNETNPSTPFLRYAPDGRLFAIWTEEHDIPWRQEKHPAKHQHGSGDRALSPMRNALLAWSADAGKTWSSPAQVNSAVEA